MSHPQANINSDRLILLIKSAYWGALLIIAAMALASFVLMQQMIAAQQRDEALLALASSQKTLSQRIVLLAYAVSAPDADKSALSMALRTAVSEFETDYDRLLEQSGADPASPSRRDPQSIEHVLFAAPYHLDYFSVGLAANGRRLVAAIEGQIDIGEGVPKYIAGRESALLDEIVANATLRGFTALGERFNASAKQRLEGVLTTNRTLFYTTIGVIVLVALLIFRPMSEVILRRTLELVEARNSLAFIAAHDGLTGLYNRTFLTDHFDELIHDATRRGERLAVVQLDLDRFKQINDTLGHAAGDYVLVVTAQRMRDACRTTDVCVRLGGDEFVMILSDPGTTGDIGVVARRIMARINEPIIFQGATILPGASAGIAIYPIDGDNGRDLIVHADLALYAAKKQGGGGFSFFSDGLRRELEHRRHLEHDLRVAISEQAFEVHFQPQVRLSDDSVAGVEALVRWEHPERGMVRPGAFIPVAETSGLMAAVGRIIATKAIATAAEWHRSGVYFGRLAVNVSGAELREPDFDAFLFETLERAGLPPQKLSLEIVESVILDDEKTGIAAKLRQIRAAGVHLELDDFGTGYASLSHVNPKEIDRLKIDRRFVHEIDSNGDNMKIVRAITELARGLGIAIIAEGAETKAELATLLSVGCDQVQGQAIAFPMPADKAGDWLAARSGARQLALKQGGRA